MRGLARVIRKDLGELLLDARALAALIVLPSLVLLLVGQLRAHPERFELLVANANAAECSVDTAARSVDADAEARRIFRVLEELSFVHVAYELCEEATPLARMREDGIDIVINYESVESAAIYVAETDPRRLRQLLELARALQLTTIGEFGSDVRREGEGLLGIVRLGALGGYPMQGAEVYYPQGLDRRLSLLPSTLALIVCFLPFVIAAPSLLRERESRTLEVLLSAPSTSGNAVFIGKCVPAIAVTLVSLLLMLVVLQSVYGLGVKPGLPGFLLFLLLPMLSSALLGLAVSALSASQAQVVVSAALYFLVLMLFGGFFFVPGEGSALIRGLSTLLPLTFTVAPANAFLFGAPVESGFDGGVYRLGAQVLGYGALASAAWRYRLRRV